MSKGIFPDSWKIARVAPVYKGGPADDQSNYRSISILPADARLFEKLVFELLYSKQSALGRCIQF